MSSARALLAVALGLPLIAALWDRAGDDGGRLVPGTAPFRPGVHRLGAFEVRWEGTDWHDAALRIVHVARRERPEWASRPGRSFVGAARGRERVRESRGSFVIDDRLDARCSNQTVDATDADAAHLTLRGQLRCGERTAGYAMTFTPASEHQLRFDVALTDPSFNRVALIFASHAAERFFGFGEQFTHFDLKGRLVPILVQEQGIGRGRQPLTWLVNRVAGAGGAWHTTYAPVPQYLTSERRALFLENTEYATFDLRAPERVRIAVFASRLAGRLLHGDTPLELIREYTTWAGRMRPLPPWVHHGAVVGVQGGTARVREVWQKLRALDTPIAAFWLQDWVGQRVTSFGKQLWWNWELDRDRYPDWERLGADLAAQGIRVMTYVNPFLVDVAEKPHARNLFREARERGFLVRRASGEPYLILNTSFSAGLLDLTNPAAREWMIGVLQEQVISAGASGWMADFGEALPYDAVLADGTAPVFHNRYPEAWAALNRAAIERSGRGDDLVFFSRSGFTRSPGASTLFWLGDQLVSWDRHDGIKSAVTGLLSGGLAGFAFNHGDIGGYTTIDRPLIGQRRSKELLLRWIELAAFQVVYRTHEGNVPEANHQFDGDAETLAHFSRFAKVHAAWAFYRDELIREASATGAPVARHLFLHYPDDPVTWTLTHEEFLLGSELLVAPVLDPGRDRVRVYLPAGRWVHAWSGQGYGDPARGTWVTVSAPIGEPAAFHRDGSAVGARFRAALAGLTARDTSVR
jgi:alpha-glucosidase